MKFEKANFSIDGSKEVWVNYNDEFIGRFKYARAKSSANDFVKFLIKNFDVEEFFNKRKEGIAPLNILKEKGYESLNVRKAKENGTYRTFR